MMKPTIATISQFGQHERGWEWGREGTTARQFPIRVEGQSGPEGIAMFFPAKAYQVATASEDGCILTFILC